MTDNANAHPQSSPDSQPASPAVPTPASTGPGFAYPSQQPYPGGYAFQPPAAPPSAPGSGKALASLICGICAIVFSGTVVFGVALGIVAIVLAVQYAKSFGKDAKAVAGKVCGIAGVVCSVAMLAFYLVMGTIFFEIVLDDLHDARQSIPAVIAPETSMTPDSPAPNATPDASQEVDIAAAKQAVAAQLDLLASPDQATLDAIAREADREFADDLGFSLAEIGMDSVQFAAWLSEGVEYRDDANVRLSGDGTGEVVVTVQARSFKDLALSLAGQTSAYASPERSEHGAAALDDAAKASLAELVQAAMDKAPATVSSTFSVDVVKAGGTWAVEHDEFDSIIDDAFDL